MMIRVCRAEDGQIFNVKGTLRDIERFGSLEGFIQQETGIEADGVLAYLTDGRRLTTANIREFAGSQDQSIFVFNKYYLEYELEDVIRELTIEPPLQPPIEESIAATPPFRPTQLAASYLHAAHTHLDHIKHIALTLRTQHEAIRIASSGLDMNVLVVLDTFDSLGLGLRKELQKQTSLLAGLEADLEFISKVRVHTDFVSLTARKAIEAGEKHRTLGDYVANDKMKQVAETCSKTHEDLQARYDTMERKISKLRESCDAVRASISSSGILDETDSHLRLSQEIVDSIAHAADALENPKAESEQLLQDLKRLDGNLRTELEFICDLKNANTRPCRIALRHITVINNELVQIAPELTALQASFKGKNSFSHIQRLHNMIYAYGATVIEIVRRKEFSQFFFHRAQSILEVMAKLSSSERKRRQVYRSEIHGQLPFETKGMDDPVPTIDFSPSGGTSDQMYSLDREDVNGLLHVLEDLEEASKSRNDIAALSAVRECRTGLEKLVGKMDGLEAGFDKIAERSLLSASRLSVSRRRSMEAEEQMYNELVERVRSVEDAKVQQETFFIEERVSLQTQLHRLQADFRSSHTDATHERERADRLERELHQVRAQLESEGTARRIKEERNAELLNDLETQGAELAQALMDVTDRTRVSEALKQELAQVRHEFEDVKALEARNSEKVANLLVEQANNLKNLEEARARGEDLEEQICAARAESEGVNIALKEASEEKDWLLRAQASEHDRVLRDHIAEADGDRAVLERQFFESKAAKEHAERQLKELKSELEVERADGAGLREELQRVEHELREARHVERVLRDDLKIGRSSQEVFENQLENSNRLLAQVLDAAIAFRASHLKALRTAQSISSHPTSRQSVSASLIVDPTGIFSPEIRHSIIGHPETEEPLPIDPSDPAGALELLRAFDHDLFQEAIAKTGSTVRKWQKQCKEYRERAKGKISFRNFAKGDLALFLPTRNSVSKPWAAFNVSFPHYFLQATGHLAEQLKSREWIVARITSIAERIVDSNDPTSNPYGLGDGVKYYMLEVEDWTKSTSPAAHGGTHPKQQQRKGSSSRKPVTSSEGEVEEQKEVKDSKEKEKLKILNNHGAIDTVPPPPAAEREESFFEVTHPPNSHLFPSRTRTRTRSNSTPQSASARPSSLSRLLAQADPDTEVTSPEPLTSTPVSTSAPERSALGEMPVPTATTTVNEALLPSRTDDTSLSRPLTTTQTRTEVAASNKPFTPPPTGSSSVSQTASSPANAKAPFPLSSPPSSPSGLYHPANMIPMPESGGSGNPTVTISTPTAQQTSPLRPGSRASRLSTTSGSTATAATTNVRFRLGSLAGSGGSTPIPIKAAATTALAGMTSPEMTLTQSPSSGEDILAGTTPSPEGSISDGMANLLRSSSTRRRTSSYHTKRKSPLVPGGGSTSTSTGQRNSSYVPPPPKSKSSISSTAKADSAAIASSKSSVSPNAAGGIGMLSGFRLSPGSWGVSFGRKKVEGEMTHQPEESRGEGGRGGEDLAPRRDRSSSGSTSTSAARQLLRQFPSS